MNYSNYITLLIACLVAWVGVQQYILAHEKFKLDLFEKRFAVYKATEKFLVTIMKNPAIGWDDPVMFLRETHDAVFLFGQEIVDYLDSLYKKALDMKDLQQKLEPLQVGTERSALCQQESQLVIELTGELPKLPTVFGAYLRFRSWKRPSWFI
jgi:hypothetical protein